MTAAHAIGQRLICAQKPLSAPKGSLRRKQPMTIAIGAYFRGGMIVCADTNIVATDLVVKSGCKISVRDCRNGDSYVIANASDDGNAGTMLSQEILDALSGVSVDLEQTVKTTMRNWHSGYPQGAAPQMNFVLAAKTGT